MQETRVKISFPVDAYEKHATQKLKEFNFAAMILVALSRYCTCLIFSEIFSLNFNYKQKYSYYFSPFEIVSLGLKTENEIIHKYSLKTNFDFVLSTFEKRYTGEIQINVSLQNNGTFETSYYKLDIDVRNCANLEITPFFLNLTGMQFHIAEFMQKFWAPIWKELYGKIIETKTKRIENIFLLEQNEVIRNLLLQTCFGDFVYDVLCIVTSFAFCQNALNDVFFVYCDDIMRARELKENRNSAGCRGGYKLHEKQKIHFALYILNLFELLIVREVNKFGYFVVIPYKSRFLSPKILPLKLVTYSYKSKLWHKRFGFYLRRDFKKSVKVKVLMSLVDKLCNTYKPSQVRERFECVMDELCVDGVLKYWHYADIDEDVLLGKNWIENWKNLTIICRY